MIPTFLLEQMEGWSCHYLRWGSQGGARFREGNQELRYGHVEISLDIQVETS